MFAKRRAAAIQKAVPVAAVKNAIQKAVPASAQPKSMMPPPRGMNRFFQAAKGMRLSKGGAVSSGRGDGIAVRGKTKCKMY